MVTQVVFTAQKNLKDKALSKARSEGITLKAFLVACMKEYVQGGLDMGLRQYFAEPEVEIVEVDEKTQRKMDSIALQWRKIKKVA
jgi:hypothetical protein